MAGRVSILPERRQIPHPLKEPSLFEQRHSRQQITRRQFDQQAIFQKAQKPSHVRASKPVTTTILSVRSAANQTESEQLGSLAGAAFSPDVPAAQYQEFWQKMLTHAGDIQPESQRVVVDPATGHVLGGYLLRQRTLCIGPARLLTGCIGGVVVAPTARKRGIASLLMGDAIEYAGNHQLALLFLTGIPNFYHRFDFAPVLDWSDTKLNRSELRTMPRPQTVTVRAAGVEDAPALLALYRAGYLAHPGSFDRQLDEQFVRLRHLGDRQETIVAWEGEEAGDQGAIAGYLLLRRAGHEIRLREIAARTWPALIALLHYLDDELLTLESSQGVTPSTEIICPIPPASTLFFMLTEHLSARSEQLHHFSADWMARAGDLNALVHGLAPVWSQQVQRMGTPFTGTLALTVERHHFQLEIDPSGVRASNAPSAAEARGDKAITLTGKALTQLAFGYRPPAWFAGRSDQQIEATMVPLLDVLFPPRRGWVAGSDSF